MNGGDDRHDQAHSDSRNSRIEKIGESFHISIS